MRARVFRVAACTVFFAIALFSAASGAKDGEMHVTTTTIHGSIDPQNNSQLAPQLNTVSGVEIERIKKEAVLTTELSILKEKNLITAEFQSTFITIVVWALGVAVSIVLVLVTASFFTSFKVHERDIKRIQDDYDAKLKILNSDVDSKLSRVNRDIDARHEARSQQDLDRMLSQATEIRSQFEQFRGALEEKVAETLKSAARAEVKSDKNQESHLKLSSEISRLEISIWELKKVPGNILIASVEGLNTALQRKDQWSIDNFSKIIKEVIQEHYVTTQRPLSPFHVEFLSKCMENLSKERPEQSAEILSILAACVHAKKEGN